MSYNPKPFDAVHNEANRLIIEGDIDDVDRAITQVLILDMRLKKKRADLLRESSLHRAEAAIDSLFGSS